MKTVKGRKVSLSAETVGGPTSKGVTSIANGWVICRYAKGVIYHLYACLMYNLDYH